MTDLKNTAPHARMHRKRRFHVHPWSLGSGFENFDVPDFRVNGSNPIRNRPKTRSNFDAPDFHGSSSNPIRNSRKTQSNFDVPGFRVSGSNAIVNFDFRPEPNQYIAGWFKCVSWSLLSGFIALNIDLQDGSLSLLFALLLGLAVLISRCFE